jgi:HD superfamily phosphohydrolase
VRFWFVCRKAVGSTDDFSRHARIVSDLPYPLKGAITVQDAVHGRVWLTRLEEQLVNTAEFQRLRHIVQLGLADYVFPTATHSRLAHSLGATHVMGWMLRQSTLQEYFKGREDFIQLLRLAALLHDLGHYPFSHLGENVYGAVEHGATAEFGNGSPTTVFDVAAQIRPHAQASHEHLTAAVIRSTRIGEIINGEISQLDGRDATEVLIDIINGEHTDSVCHSLISSDLDCDRLDYLVRDSASAGLTYGQVDLAYLIENLRVEDHPRYGPVLAVDLDHGYGAVEHYLHARYFHYARFITHKTIASAELLLAVAMLELIKAKLLPANAAEVEESIESRTFLDFTDARVWCLLHEAAGDEKATPELNEAAASLLNRTLLKCAYNLEALESEDEEVYEQVRLDRLLATSKQKQKVAAAAKVPSEAFCYKRTTTRTTGIPARIVPKAGETEKFEWIETVNVARPGEVPTPVVLQRGLLQNLSTRRWVTRRVFVREPEFGAAGKTAADRPDTYKLNRYLDEELAR